MITHALSATTPDDPTYEIRPTHWNQAHVEVRALSGNTVGASTVSGSNVILQAGNNITLSANNDTLVLIGPNPAGGAFSAGVSTGGNTAGATGISGTQLVLVGSNNVTLSQTTGANGATVSILAASQTAQTQNVVVPSAGTQTATSGTVVFANSNGVTFGMSGSSQITASYTVPTVTNSSLTLSDTATSITAARLAFTGSNGITMGLSTGGGGSATVTASYTVPTQTNQTVGLYASSNTTGQSSSSTVDARSISVVGAGVASVGLSGGSFVVSVPSGGGAGDGGNTIAAGTRTATSSGSVLFGNANGISFGLDAPNGTQLTASYTVPTVTNSSLTLSDTATSITAARLAFTGSNGITMGLSTGGGGSATVTASYTVPTVPAQFTGGFSTNGNTVGNTGLVTGQLVLAGGNNITLSGSTNGGSITITVSGPNAGGAQTGISGIQVSDTTYTSGTVTFRNANGISFGSSGANGISASYTVPTVTNSSWTASDTATSLTIARLALTGSNGITMGLSTAAGGSATITASYTVPTQTNQSIGLYASSQTTGQSSSSTVDARSVSIVGAGVASVGLSGGSFIVSVPSVAGGSFSAGASNLGDTAGNTGVTGTRLVFVGSNGITLSQTTGAAGATLSFIQASNLSAGVTNAGNTLGNTGFVTGQFNLQGGNNITLSGSTNGGSMSVTVIGGGGAFSAGASNLGNTAGSTGISGSQLVLVGSGVVSLSQSTGANGGTVSILAPATSSIVGQSGISISSNGSTITVQPSTQSYAAYPERMNNSMSMTVGSNTSYVWPFNIDDVQQFDFIRIPQTVSMASMASIATAANTTFSYNQQATSNFVLYTRGIGASSQSLQSVGSTSGSSRMSINLQENANGSQWSVTHAFSWPASNGTTSSSTSYATTLSNVNISTTHLTAISGMKFAAFPWSSTIQDGPYWMASGIQTAQTTQGNASLSNMRITLSQWAFSQMNNTWGEFGSANNATVQALYGIGSYSNAATGTTGSIGFSNISSSASHPIPFVTFARIA